MSIVLKADIGQKVKIKETGEIGEITCIHGYGSVRGFQKLYEPAFEIETESGKQRYSSEDFEPES